MKTGRSLRAILLILLMVIGQSCINGKNYGPLVKETRKVKNFDGLEVSHGIDVFLTMGNNEHLELEAPEGLIEHLVTEVKGETLKIYLDKNLGWTYSDIKIYLEAKKIQKIHASGGSDVKCENTIESRDLDLRASGGSDIKLEVDTKNLEVNVSGGADIVLSGKTEEITAKTSGGSDLKAFDLVAQYADLEASGGSDIKITVEEELEARTSGGADIEYMGDPQKVDTKASTSSDIRKRN